MTVWMYMNHFVRSEREGLVNNIQCRSTLDVSAEPHSCMDGFQKLGKHNDNTWQSRV